MSLRTHPKEKVIRVSVQLSPYQAMIKSVTFRILSIGRPNYLSHYPSLHIVAGKIENMDGGRNDDP